MKKPIALFCACLLSINLALAGFAFLLPAGQAEAADSIGVPAPGRGVGVGDDSPFGLNIHSASRYAIPGQLQVPLDSAKGTGAAWDREEIRWNMVQKADNSFDFGLVDEAVNKARERGFRVLGLLVYNRDNSKTMPDLDAWNQYVKNTVAHFQGRIDYFQIWNEPENEVYLRGANPADYARLLRSSYAAVKAGNPNAKVVTAGVNGLAVPWLERMMAAGGEGQYDVLGVHPYVSFPTSPDSKYWIDQQLAYFMAFTRRHGNKPVWATEFGWPTQIDPASVSESMQANYLARSYVMGLASGLSKMFVYQFHDEGTQDSYGIVHPNWTSPKASYSAYKNLVNQLSGAVYRDKIDLFDNTRQNLVDFESGAAWGSFNEGNNSSSLSLSTDPRHGGSRSLKVDYGLNGGAYIETGPSSAVALNGQPTKVGFWIFGDDTSTLFRIVIQGSDNQLFFYEPGKAGGKYWHRLEAYLPGENVYHTGDGVLRYPISFKSIQLTRQPDPLELTWNSTLYLDDFYAEGGPNVQLYRFEKNGRNLDVIWSDGQAVNLGIPTQSNQSDVKAYNRDGGTPNFNVTNGTLNLTASDDMQFFEHVASPVGDGTPTGGGTGPCISSNPPVSPNSNFTNAAFQNFWARYDQLAPGNRSYVWGDKPFAAGSEPYTQSPGGNRQVLYFDKSRMEINNPNGNPNSLGYVTNGLLTVELMTGKLQKGDNLDDPNQFILCKPAQVRVAGDPDDTSGPTYAALANRRGDGPKGVGQPVTESVDANGNVGTFGGAGQYGVVGGYLEPITNHTIAKPFWDFLNDANQRILVNGQQQIGKLFDPYYVAPGLPITEAYWAKVKVGGQVKDVLIQAFERRVLTYTPSNPPAFRVEWGNIGRHYYTWRYGGNP